MIYSSGMQRQRSGTVTHSHIGSPDVCLGYNNDYVCHECIYVTEVGVATQKFFATLRTPVAGNPPF